MKKIIGLITCILLFASCHREVSMETSIITSDIDNFWLTYDKIIAVEDSVEQLKLLKELYLDKGSPGLKGIMEAKNYTPLDFINVINQYPKFWKSIRNNTLKAKTIADDLNLGIEKFREIYPELKPAKVYFTIGAMGSNGTTKDSMVLIGSEFAMADENISTSEFPERMQKGLSTFFASNPINSLVLLNIHEYVHTQQKTIVNNLLSQSLYEGVAEFVSVKAMGVFSDVPAIEYGKSNPEVKARFEKVMFYGNNTYEWLWSNAPNEFNVRDLGYYIGYAICEEYYQRAENKQQAIKDMIELDYNNEKQIEQFVDGTNFFSKPLSDLYREYEYARPKVISITGLKNGSKRVKPGLTKIKVNFSEPLNGYNTGIDFGPLGKEFFPELSRERVWSEDAKSWTIEADLKPGQQYQILISNNFRKKNGTPLKPYLIDFKTSGS